MAKEKEYTGTITLGATTPTYDLESEPESNMPFENIAETDIKNAVSTLTGTILQIPPIHSAIKKDGKRVYELARRGEEVKLEPRAITISEFEISDIQLPVISFKVVCSTGTYIRSLANDFGQLLKCGGYLSSLCRTRIGEFTLSNALTMEEFEESIKQNQKG